MLVLTTSRTASAEASLARHFLTAGYWFWPFPSHNLVFFSHVSHDIHDIPYTTRDAILRRGNSASPKPGWSKIIPERETRRAKSIWSRYRAPKPGVCRAGPLGMSFELDWRGESGSDLANAQRLGSTYTGPNREPGPYLQEFCDDAHTQMTLAEEDQKNKTKLWKGSPWLLDSKSSSLLLQEQD